MKEKLKALANLPEGFDLQAHRGGRGQWTEESAHAMRSSLALGVTTLEFDIVLSRDRVPVVWHDPVLAAEKCSDTEPAFVGDVQFPYVGKLVHDLTFAQLATVECAKKLADFPDAEVAADNRLLTLPELFELAAHNERVHFNIETKIEAARPGDSATPQEFVDAILDAVVAAGVADRVMIQSFNWRSLPLVAEQNPEIPLVMLWDHTTWAPGSPWTGVVDFDAVNGDIVEAATQIGAHVLSPGYSVPYGATPRDADYHLVATPELVTRAHRAGLTVVPWTVNDREAMREQIAAGVDGLITDYPSRLREVMAELDMELPQP